MLYHWLMLLTGADNESGTIYGLWSGFGSDLGEVTIIGGMIALYRRHTCHIHRCWRLAKHPVDGTGYMVCRKHHPEGHLTAASLAARVGGGS